jgi:hypothetical protein
MSRPTAAWGRRNSHRSSASGGSLSRPSRGEGMRPEREFRAEANHRSACQGERQDGGHDYKSPTIHEDTSNAESRRQALSILPKPAFPRSRGPFEDGISQIASKCGGRAGDVIGCGAEDGSCRH